MDAGQDSPRPGDRGPVPRLNLLHPPGACVRLMEILARGTDMKKSWRKPKVREISAAMEINCYCSAE